MAKNRLEEHPLAQEQSECFCLEVREQSQRPTLLSPLASAMRDSQWDTLVDYSSRIVLLYKIYRQFIPFMHLYGVCLMIRT